MKLVTGSKGFIAGHYLEANEAHVFDIQDESPIPKLQVDEVIHLGAMTDAFKSINHFHTYWHYNVTMSRKIFDLYKDAKIFFASSAGVYSIKNPYSLTKSISEDDLQEIANHWTIGRFFNVFGERAEKGFIYHAIKAAIQNKPIIIYSGGNQTRDFIYVKDVVDNIRHDRRIYDIGYGAGMSLNQVARKIIEKTNSKSCISYKEKQEGDVVHSRLAEQIQSNDFYYGFEKGLERTIDYMMKNS